MVEKEILEQLNKEIEEVDLPVTPLNNVLREMRLEKDKKAVKKQKGKLTVRMKRFIAVACSVAFVAVITPIMLSQSALLNAKSEQPPSATNAPSVTNFSGSMKMFSSVDEVYKETKSEVPLPRATEFEGETCIYSVYYDQSNPYKVEATYGEKLKVSVMLIDIEGAKVSGTDEVDIGLTNNATGNGDESAGALYFTFDNFNIILGYYNVSSYDDVLKLIQTIQ